MRSGVPILQTITAGSISRTIDGSTAGRFGATLGVFDINRNGYLDLLTSANATTAFDGKAYTNRQK